MLLFLVAGETGPGRGETCDSMCPNQSPTGTSEPNICINGNRGEQGQAGMPGAVAPFPEQSTFQYLYYVKFLTYTHRYILVDTTPAKALI